MKTKADITTQLARLASSDANSVAMLAEIMAYAGTDLLCYRASDEVLSARQNALYDPILATLEKTYGITMHTTDTLSPIAQPSASLDKICALIEAASPRELAALFALTPLLGSALLSVALWKRHITVDGAIAASQLDETFQAEQWGEDAAEKSVREKKTEDIRQCAIFLDI